MTKKKSDCNTDQQDVLFLIPTLHLISSNLLFRLSFFVEFGFTLSRNNSSKLLFANDVAAVELNATSTGKSSHLASIENFLV